ncbi:hypothetical protein, partial [Erwinia amylovora]|uniref:hypothetical protein n=1 Tax=Erwinia amylovora TaxID=552 RepID=UPI0020BD7FB0
VQNYKLTFTQWQRQFVQASDYVTNLPGLTRMMKHINIVGKGKQVMLVLDKKVLKIAADTFEAES